MKTKILSIIEVGVVLGLMFFLFRFVQSAPIAAKITKTLDGLLFPGYAVLLIASALIYLFRCRVRSHIPLSEKGRYQVEIVVAGFLPTFTLGVLLAQIDWTQWPGAILISVVEIGLLFWFAWMVRNKRPRWQKMSIGSSLFLFPVMAFVSTRLGRVLVAVLYFYLFVALSEEILFRGYIQSRLNAAFGRPKRFWGIRWGWGLVITSLLFGLWHLGCGSGVWSWPHVLWTAFAGVLFGLVREKSESVIAPAILHGLMNYGPQAILFYLFWSS